MTVERDQAERETAEIMADPDALDAIAEAREGMARGEVYSTDQVLAELAERQR